MIMNVKERLKIYLKQINSTISAFETSIHVTNGYVNSISKSIGIDKIETILEKYPNLNIEWLLAGKGEMLKIYDQKILTENDISKINSKIPVAKQANGLKEGIPLIPIEAMAGFGGGDIQVLELDCEYFTIPTFKGADFLIQVKGSSMYPKYNSGDIVACKKLVRDDIFFQWNKVYVFDTEQGALIKRIGPGKDDDHVMIISDNEKYQPFNLPKKKIHAISIVMGVIRLE